MSRLFDHSPPMCRLCGHTGSDVKGSWARWKEPAEGQAPFEAIDRCQDRAACRKRCEAQGDPWLVADTVAELPKPPDPRKPAAPDQTPAQPVEVAAP